MQPGELNRRITFYKKIKAINEMNQTTHEFREYKSLWAKIQPMTNRAVLSAADTLASEITHKITVRYRKDITKDMYIMYGLKRFDIKASPIDPYMSHEWLEISVAEVDE